MCHAVQSMHRGNAGKRYGKDIRPEWYVESTPPRNRVWQVQTPQVFETALIIQAYDELIDREEELLEQHVTITDDAMVVEYFTQTQVKFVEGSYQNIKITTPEDLLIAEAFLQKQR
mgnify:CR=1 FL=1